MFIHLNPIDAINPERLTSIKILITGDADFIGSTVIRYIINFTNNLVIYVDKLAYAGNLEQLHEVRDNSRYTFEQVNICHRGSL